jgi:transposase
MEEFSDVQFQQRAVIEFLTAENFPQIEIHRRLQAVYGDQCVGVSTTRRWVWRFKDGELGQADLSDKTRTGRPVTACDQLHQDRVEELIRGNCGIQQKEIAVALGISERMGHIDGYLWIPKILYQIGNAHDV